MAEILANEGVLNPEPPDGRLAVVEGTPAEEMPTE